MLHHILLTGLFMLSSLNLSLATQPDTCRGIITFDSSYVVHVCSSLPNYYVRLIEREDTTERYKRWFYEFRIQRSVNDTLFQDICGESDSPFDDMNEDDYPGIQFVDLNFDGYLDIKMFDNQAANGVNSGYAAYLFSPIAQKFYRSEQFSDILGGYSVELDPAKKEIT